MAVDPEFSIIFNSLKTIMQEETPGLTVLKDTEDDFSVETDHIMPNKKRLWFGGVQIRKNYVSYHLMPVYTNPELLDEASPGLRKKMQGKSCFNFRKNDPGLFAALRRLTRTCFETYHEKGFTTA